MEVEYLSCFIMILVLSYVDFIQNVINLNKFLIMWLNVKGNVSTWGVHTGPHGFKIKIKTRKLFSLLLILKWPIFLDKHSPLLGKDFSTSCSQFFINNNCTIFRRIGLKAVKNNLFEILYTIFRIFEKILGRSCKRPFWENLKKIAKMTIFQNFERI